MRNVILTCLIWVFLLCHSAFAGVTWEILSYQIDTNGNIEVHTQYKIDGVEVVSRYPQESGKYYWVTRYDAQNFINMTPEQIKARISLDLQANAESLGARAWLKNETIKIHDTALGGLIGIKGNSAQSEIKVDTDGDNLADKVFTVKSTGEKVSEEAIVTP